MVLRRVLVPAVRRRSRRQPWCSRPHWPHRLGRRTVGRAVGLPPVQHTGVHQLILLSQGPSDPGGVYVLGESSRAQITPASAAGQSPRGCDGPHPTLPPRFGGGRTIVATSGCREGPAPVAIAHSEGVFPGTRRLPSHAMICTSTRRARCLRHSVIRAHCGDYTDLWGWASGAVSSTRCAPYGLREVPTACAACATALRRNASHWASPRSTDLRPCWRPLATDAWQMGPPAVWTSSTRTLRAHPRTTGLLRYFDFVLTNGDYEHTKPHRLGDLAALARCRADTAALHRDRGLGARCWPRPRRGSALIFVPAG